MINSTGGVDGRWVVAIVGGEEMITINRHTIGNEEFDEEENEEDEES